MKILFASDSFKGTLSSEQTAALLETAARKVFPDCTTDYVPVADGGEGTVEALVKATGGSLIEVPVHGPLMEDRVATYGRLDDHRAVIEMAAASGLPMVPEDKRNPLNTTSYGTGELIRDALDKGFDEISIAIGGSATNDGGMGCARALGIKFLDEAGRELEGFGRDLSAVSSIDVSGIDPRIASTKITVMCDVTNPLCGPDGATNTFGKQKGGTPEILEQLEAGMCRYRDLIIDTLHDNPDEYPGAGAAGGLGAALKVFFRGEMKSGIETVLDLLDFNARLQNVDLVVTGEGRTDWQSAFGKVMQGIGVRCRAAGIPAVGLSGSLGEGAAQIFDHGIASLMTTVDAPMPLEEALSRAEELYALGAERMFRMIKVGMDLR